MDYEKLCEDLREHNYWCGSMGKYAHDIHLKICDDAVIAIKQLQSENRSTRQNSVSMDVYKAIMDENTDLIRQLSEKSLLLDKAVEDINSYGSNCMICAKSKTCDGEIIDGCFKWNGVVQK